MYSWNQKYEKVQKSGNVEENGFWVILIKLDFYKHYNYKKAHNLFIFNV